MTGPHGEKRPDSPIANAALIVRLATGQAEEQYVCTAKRDRLAGANRPAGSRDRPNQ